ncbi:hypothetical protein, partial [Anaerotignum sp.]|uniref:hypothetical protein n=1 Tax=Anaerotignum sp. TaxID=2039241 RepID=UPI00289F0B9E
IKDVFGGTYTAVMGKGFLAPIDTGVFSGSFENKGIVTAIDELYLYVAIKVYPNTLIRRYKLPDATFVDEKIVTGETLSFYGSINSFMCVNDDYIFIVNPDIVRINKSTFVAEQKITPTSAVFACAKCDNNYLYTSTSSGVFTRYLVGNLTSKLEKADMTKNMFCLKDGFVYAVSYKSPYYLNKHYASDLSFVYSSPCVEHAVVDVNENGNIVVAGLGFNTSELSPVNLSVLRKLNSSLIKMSVNSPLKGIYKDGQFVIWQKQAGTDFGGVYTNIIHKIDMNADFLASSKVLIDETYPILLVGSFVCCASLSDKITLIGMRGIEGYLYGEGLA